MLEKHFLNLSFSLLTGIFVIFLLSFIGFIFGFSITPIYTFIGIITAISLLIYRTKSDKELNIWPVLGLLALIITISAILALSYYDDSWDGRCYHQGAAILLNKGWNPVFTTIEDFTKTQTIKYSSIWLWVQNYPKFFEIFTANMLSMFGKIELGKIINYLFCFGTFFYSFYVLNLFSKLSKVQNSILSLLLVYNPVSIYQMSTFYVDGALYYMFLTLILSIIHLEKNTDKSKTAWAFLIMSCVILANIKMLGLLYVFILLAVYFFYLIMNKSFKELKPLITSCALVLALIILSGINPYYTNIKQNRHPFYPIAGKDKIDIMTSTSPVSFKDKNMFYKLFISTFSRTVNEPFSERKIELKIPFSINHEDKFTAPDMRIGGFGYFWSGILLVSLILAAGIRFKEKKNKKIFLLLSTILILSILANPECWWARYAPQFWALPVFIITFSAIETNIFMKNKFLFYFLCLLIFVNSLILNITNAKTTKEHTKLIRGQINNLQRTQKEVKIYEDLENPSIYEPFLQKLSEKGIKYEMVSQEEFEKHRDDYGLVVYNMDKKLYWNYKF